jgi:arylsulfatase A-like enzyme
LTGFSSGFDQPVKSGGERWKYGGLSASNAYTTGTYTLKSVVGTVCGVAPMVTDFNREFQHQFYQPCMPHILDVLNEQPGVSNQTDDFKSWPWHSMWMQSVTETYDYQEPLTPAMGFKEIITKESLTNPNASHYPPKSKEINYYGYPDTELRDYLRDAIEDAERDHKRLFISHLTGTTHHPWGIPGGKYDELIKHEWKGRNKDVNKYLNTIGWVDKWLAEILDILAETGVADQTLLVMAGDQ